MKSTRFIVFLLGIYLPVSGLAAEQVEVLRDPWGVPHIFASTEEQGFFGLGYASAEDRRLQMELVRRKGAGRLAEVFGPEWVQSDRESRLAGYPAWSGEALTKLPAEMQNWLSAYAAGVNAWTSAHGELVASRFQPLGVAPEPWTPADCLLAARAVLSLSSPFSDQSVSQYHRFQELVAQGGEAAAEQQFHMAVEDAAAIVSESEMAKDAEAYQRLKQRPRMPGFLLQGTPTDGPKMSHAWAVSGARSKTGKPLLESDPQLPLCTPPFFYEFHLSAGSVDARGVGVPGCPGLFIGFNRHIAWGGSALGTGSQAVFLEQLAADRQGYLFAGKTEPFTRRLERIRVKEGPDVVQEVLNTRHGVVFNSLSQNTRPGEAHVLYDPQTMQCGTTVRAMLAFLTASNWTEFRAAMEHYYDPGLHVVFADDQNNIGYQTLVHRPLTARSPRMAQEGWTGQQEIVERIPLDELPHMLNPEQGFISHANNMSVGTWYPFDLGLGTGGNGHTGRSWRLQQLLSGTHLYGIEDFEASVHRDAVNPLLTALLPIAIKVADEDQVDDATVQRLISAVRGWDLSPATVQDYPAVAALGNVLTPYRGSGLNDSYGAGMGGVTNLARRLAADFARDGATPRGERERAYLKRWLQASAQGTPGRGRGSAATDEWTARMRQGAPEAAGRTITMPYQGMTPLQLPKIDPALDIVSPPLTCLDTGTIWSQPGNVYTHIVDLAEIDNSRAMIAPGNSEDAASPLRTVGIELWVQGRTRPAPLSRDKVERLQCTATRLDVQAYDGPLASPTLTVVQPDPAARVVAAIPAVVATPETVPARPRPADAQKPDDPQLESAFRVILRAQGTSNDEVDRQLAEARKLVEGKPELVKQLRGAAVLGIYLIEESTAGRLKVQYGSPYVLSRLRALLEELDAKQPPLQDRPGAGTRDQASEKATSDSSPAGGSAAAHPEVWLCAGDRTLELLQPKAEWPFVKRHLAGIKLYVGQLYGQRRETREQTIERLRPLASFVRAHNLRLAVELGGCLDFSPMDETAGEWSARQELAALANYYAAGGQVDYLDLDGPVRRLLYPDNRRDGRRFESIDKAADQLVDALKLHRAAHPETKYWLLTNFPNWGYRGDVSYHARGPQRQDYGDYDQVVRTVLEKLRAAEIQLDGVTVDNPFDYLVGEHFSVELTDPKSVDWLTRVRSYEDFAREQGLTFNLIVNSERGGQESDERFYGETMQMVDTYTRAGGRPTRWFVQSWYPHPKQMLPETAPHSMTALVKAVVERTHGETPSREATDVRHAP